MLLWMTRSPLPSLRLPKSKMSLMAPWRPLRRRMKHQVMMTRWQKVRLPSRTRRLWSRMWSCCRKRQVSWSSRLLRAMQKVTARRRANRSKQNPRSRRMQAPRDL